MNTDFWNHQTSMDTRSAGCGFRFAPSWSWGNLPALNELILRIVDSVLRKSGRENPADAVLRAELKRHRGLPKAAGSEAARLVFARYRWRGWLDEKLPLPEILRRAVELQRHFDESPASFPDDDLEARAVPGWVRERVDVRPEWIRSLQMEPRLWLRARRGQRERLAEALGHCRLPTSPALADAVEYQGDEDLFRSPEFQRGDFEVQDISSQVVGIICQPAAGETWWDACAGEGGKMLHLSDLMENKGLIWASDRAAWRLKRLKLRAGRAQVFNYRGVFWDGGTKLPTKTRFDGVLVDAPCSGVGTWQKNPHARWTATESDIDELAGVQRELLAHAARAVKPGGKLVYAVCTITETETTGVVRSIEECHPEFRPLPLSNPFRSAPPAHGLWLWPHETGGNGMFIAAWRR